HLRITLGLVRATFLERQVRQCETAFSDRARFIQGSTDCQRVFVMAPRRGKITRCQRDLAELKQPLAFACLDPQLARKIQRFFLCLPREVELALREQYHAELDASRDAAPFVSELGACDER